MMKIIKKFAKKLLPNIPFSTSVYYTYRMRQMKKVFFNKLKNSEFWMETEEDSKNEYEKYNEREQVGYEFESDLCIYKGKISWMKEKEIRDNYLKYLFKEIEYLVSEKNRIRILEVGCGNCINLVNLKNKFGDKIELFGIDISNQRIEVAKKYFSQKLEGIELYEQSITKKCEKWEDNYFDVVFSMHCLEQISYNCSLALQEMYRLTKKKLIMIEPVFENGNQVQKLYLICVDHNRILIKTIRDLGYKITRNEALDIQSGGGLNQSSIVVIEK